MEFRALKIPDVMVLKPKIFDDSRGYFYEAYNEKVFNKIVNQEITFVQDNISKSKIGTLRGLHMQNEPFAQSKLVRVLEGKIFDVAVDMRPESKYFRQWVSEELSAESFNQIWIPKGFAHGFLAMTENVVIHYKTDNFYSKDHEITYKWDDPVFDIDWPMKDYKYEISEKDAKAPML
jgi:dTDP-4-dehydrorhamnose 3,5-epimerase